jgi:hypothetical protein
MGHGTSDASKAVYFLIPYVSDGLHTAANMPYTHGPFPYEDEPTGTFAGTDVCEREERERRERV